MEMEPTENPNICQWEMGKNLDLFNGKKCVVGIDEAGRGPVLGPMVYGIGIALDDSEHKLKQLGVADSKVLSEKDREEMFGQILEEGGSYWESISYILKILSPHYISTCMLRRSKFSLNDVSHEAAIQLIQKCMDSGIQITGVFVDTVGLPEAYQRKLESCFPSLSITVSKKADSLFPIVSGASICAKVRRDQLLKEWVFPESGFKAPEQGWGSGYPGDPATKTFMSDNVDHIFGYPTLVRFGWSTAQDILEKKTATVTWEDDEEGKGGKGSKSLHNFFGTKGGPPPIQRHVFFQDRHLSSLTTF